MPDFPCKEKMMLLDAFTSRVSMMSKALKAYSTCVFDGIEGSNEIKLVASISTLTIIHGNYVRHTSRI